ncbi:MAG: hypothetical protein H6Q73_2558 [Firmicutes bacterium]|nr:hypothetical protein [Bacillota bacterium]
MPPELSGGIFISGRVVMNLQKKKPIRLKGKKLAELNKAIHERDSYTCIIKRCNRHVPLGEKFHHEPPGAYKEDIIYKGCILCYSHHQLREGNEAVKVKKECQDYLRGLYPMEWETTFN